MRTDTQPESSSLFVFAHPDDEFFCLPVICRELTSGRIVTCVYLTDGGYGGQSPRIRMDESVAVLSALGLDKDHIHFIGVQDKIPDGRLNLYLDSAYISLERTVARCHLDAIYCPAWEGGHQDHDSCHVISLRLAGGHGNPPVMQFPLYNAYHTILPFNVMRTLPKNGPVSTLRVTLRDAVRYLTTVTRYRSQWKTWIALFPFALIRVLSHRRYTLQEARLARVLERPHDGKLLYERRGFANFSDISSNISMFLQQTHSPSLPNISI